MTTNNIPVSNSTRVWASVESSAAHRCDIGTIDNQSIIAIRCYRLRLPYSDRRRCSRATRCEHVQPPTTSPPSHTKSANILSVRLCSSLVCRWQQNYLSLQRRKLFGQRNALIVDRIALLRQLVVALFGCAFNNDDESNINRSK
jgi:hypothetical protein